jgi:hypothetical protein
MYPFLPLPPPAQSPRRRLLQISLQAPALHLMGMQTLGLRSLPPCLCRPQPRHRSHCPLRGRSGTIQARDHQAPYISAGHHHFYQRCPPVLIPRHLTFPHPLVQILPAQNRRRRLLRQPSRIHICSIYRSGRPEGYRGLQLGNSNATSRLQRPYYHLQQLWADLLVLVFQFFDDWTFHAHVDKRYANRADNLHCHPATFNSSIDVGNGRGRQLHSRSMALHEILFGKPNFPLTTPALIRCRELQSHFPAIQSTICAPSPTTHLQLHPLLLIPMTNSSYSFPLRAAASKPSHLPSEMLQKRFPSTCLKL